LKKVKLASDMAQLEQNSVLSDSESGSQSTESETARKLFVGGLSWQTTEDGMHQYFESLGMEVDRVMIMRDKVTGRSRGFGFVILSNAEMLDKAVSTNLHLDGRRIEAKRAIPKREMEKTLKKLFVGGIPISLNNPEFKKYFEQFGAVTEAQVMTERDTGRSRGFGFVTFQEEDTAEKVLTLQHSIQGKPVEVKKAEPKKVERQPRPIIVAPVSMPGMYFPGYPYPVAYGNTPLYGQVLAYDPAYFVAPPGTVYAPQFVPVDDSFYDQYSPTQYEEASPAPAPTPVRERASRRAVVAGPKRIDTDTRTERTWNPALVPVEMPRSMAIMDRVRVAQQQNDSVSRKKRGMSQPEPERNRGGSTTATITLPGRRSVVTPAGGGSWRSRNSGVHSNTTGATTTATTETTLTKPTTAKEGQGTLHKYFQ